MDTRDARYLVTREQIRHLPRAKHVVEVFEKRLVFDIIIGEYKSNAVVFVTSRSVQVLQILQQVADIVGPEVINELLVSQ